jgi:hypothetical protein
MIFFSSAGHTLTLHRSQARRIPNVMLLALVRPYPRNKRYKTAKFFGVLRLPMARSLQRIADKLGTLPH